MTSSKIFRRVSHRRTGRKISANELIRRLIEQATLERLLEVGSPGVLAIHISMPPGRGYPHGDPFLFILLHQHCHDQKTAADGSQAVRGTDDNSQTIEEPDEVTNLTSGFEAERRGQPRRLG